MSKNSLYLVVLFALAITGLTFFVSKTAGTQTCSVNTALNGDPASLMAGKASAASTPVSATVRGYPSWYYQEPFPADCISTSKVASLGGLNMSHLGTDLLIWLLVALSFTLGMAGFKAWRGPRMLGDKVRRV